jgi:tRNA dimethylallyltransferase
MSRSGDRDDRSRPPAIFLMGPTASGKTDMAVGLRQAFPVDIISVDSALVYRGMDVGTAKPGARTLALAPHALIDIRDPSERYSAAEFREDALAEMRGITARGRVPLLAGGTMLYFRALAEGLAPLPAADPEVRRRLKNEARANGWAALHERLARLDPATAERIHPNDPQRIQRALEVIELTGRRMSTLHEEQEASGHGYRLLKIVACPRPRSVLHERIAERWDQMVETGFLDEVRTLRQRGDLDREMPSMRCVGYRQAWAFLEGEIGREELREKALAATRQLAKRQLTWLRQETDALWYDPTEESARNAVFRKVKEFLE